MRNQDVPAQHQGGDHPQQHPTLSIAEAAQVCGVSTSTIRRYLRVGRFPGAQQVPSRVPGQPGPWRIPTQDLLGAGLDRQRPTPSGYSEERRTAGEPPDAVADRDRVHALEHALELERTRRQAAEALAAERARTIVTLEAALRALEHPRPEPVADQPATATAASLPAPARHPSQPQPSGILQMVPRPRWPKGELSQEERAAIIGRALSRERPPKRRWGWWQ
jgi:predicted DNA-binding transcriptional regulator AlpA